MLAVWELLKYKAHCKIAPEWLPGKDNRAADALSRGSVPQWVNKRLHCNLQRLARRVKYAVEAWDEIWQ